MPINQEVERQLAEQKTQTQTTFSILQEGQQQYLEGLHQFSSWPFQTEMSIPQSSECVESQLRQIVNNLQVLAKKHQLNYQKKLKSVAAINWLIWPV